MDHAGRGRKAAHGATGASSRHGAVQPGDRGAQVQRHRAAMVAGGSAQAMRVDSPGPGEGTKGDCRAAIRSSNIGATRTDWKASGKRV